MSRAEVVRTALQIILDGIERIGDMDFRRCGFNQIILDGIERLFFQIAVMYANR